MWFGIQACSTNINKLNSRLLLLYCRKMDANSQSMDDSEDLEKKWEIVMAIMNYF
jgi:hypothetical protein